MNLASLIKSARLAAGLTQQEAAKAWNIPLGTIRSWEQGQRKPGAEHLEKLFPLLSGSVKLLRKPKKLS
jgi:DNA-binding transcriptional regulator YiaG